MRVMNAIAGRFLALSPPLTLRARIMLIGAAVILAGVFLAPPMPFTQDGGVYLDMASAMAGDGALAVGDNGGVDGAPALTKELTRAVGGKVMPQYPSGYALLAAPFYAALGARGLMLMNALAAALSAWLTFRLARRLFDDEIARLAVFIFAGATFLLNYAFALWPHALALAFTLGTACCAVEGAHSDAARRRNLFLAGAGALIGAGVNIRVDVILYLPVLFVWLTLLAHPRDRLGPLWLIAGMAPGLMLAAWLNMLKFGTFTPLSYGAGGDGSESAANYLPLMLAGGTGLAALWLFNAPAMAQRAADRFGRRTATALVALAAIAAAVFAGAFLWRILYGAYVLTINLQAHNAYAQIGVERNEFGQLLFWGYPKKALIQSVPYLPLALIPLVGFFRGRNIVPTALCLLAVAAPVAFYALNQWHGGGSYNMRYFLPTTPFIAVLAAAGLAPVMAAAKVSARRALLLALLAAGIAYFSLQEIGRAIPALYAPAALYPQWLIAGCCGLGALVFVFRPGSKRAAEAALAAALFALAYAGFVNLADEAGHEKSRAELYAMAQDIDAALAGRPLVLTRLRVLTLHAERAGAAVMTPTEDNLNEARAAVLAFARAGRCVYFHNAYVVDLMAPALPPGAVDPTPLWAASARHSGDARLAFFTLAEQAGRCAL